ncbi:hypothetical protein ACH4C6_36270, partial [Streptomyces sp. NPDC017943]|uniref:hypothetical protein n=1 Tax=Streptomyces sp. NPDC017943 TaxID=3365019 RepID=UPI0037AA4DD6
MIEVIWICWSATSLLKDVLRHGKMAVLGVGGQGPGPVARWFLEPLSVRNQMFETIPCIRHSLQKRSP